MSPDPTSAPWTCPCGRVVHGNGGKSSHQAHCEVYHRVQRDSWARNLVTYRAGGRSDHEIRNAQRMLGEHQAALDAIVGKATAVSEAQLAAGQRTDPPSAAEG